MSLNSQNKEAKETISSPSPAHTVNLSTLRTEKDYRNVDIESAPSSPRQINHLLSDDFESNVVDYDGPDDPEHPVNWSYWKKVITVVLLCGVRLTTPFATSMMAPAIREIQKDLKFQSDEAASFAISAYVIGFGIGPLFLAPLSEIYGRKRIYNVGNTLFTAFTVACGLAKNLTSLIVFRVLAGFVGGAPLVNAGGTIGDMISINHRGAILSLFSAVDVLAPVVGPFAGGYITSSWGWRWIFYFLAILSGVISIVAFLFLRETYSPIILEQKAKRLRKLTGNPNLHTQRQNTRPLGSLISRAFLRPIRILILSPIVLGLSVYMSLVYGLIYVLFTTLAVIFQGVYGFDTSNSGLTFLGFGGGMVVALLVAGRFNDRIHKKLSLKYHTEKPEYRLPFLIYGALFLPIGMFIYGWTVQYRAHWILPLIGTAFAGVGTVFCLVPTQAYIIDAFPLHSASALAGNSLLRSIVGGTLPLAAPSLYAKLGYGWGNSLLGFLALAFGGLPILFYKYGEVLRKRFPVNLDD